MKILSLLALCAATAIGVVTSVSADAQQSDIEKAVLNDRKLLDYLEVNEAPTFKKVFRFSEDVNGDGIKDEVYSGYTEGHAFVAFGFTDKDGEFTYGGFSPVDSSFEPKVSVRDFTGDGKAEVHVVSNRGENTKMVTLVGVKDGKAKRLFRETLSTKTVSSLVHHKVTKFINFVDNDKDGVREISVSERKTLLIGKGATEREIAGSSVTSSTVYAINKGEYAITKHEAGELSADAQLSVANTLVAAGENARAKAMLTDLLKLDGLDDQLAVAGMALMSAIEKDYGKLKVAEGKPVKS